MKRQTELNKRVQELRRKCPCKVCRQNAQIRGIIRRGDKKEMRQCIDELSEVLCNIEEELAMANAYIEDLKKGMPQ